MLNKELLDLVNENYQDFLSLGSTLKGGEEKVEDVRVGLLGYQKDVFAVRERIDTRREEVKGLLDERRHLLGQAELGRALLEISERTDELEDTLMIGVDMASGGETPQDSDESGNESDDIEDIVSGTKGPTPLSLKKLERQIQRYLLITTLSDHVGSQHPFVVQQRERILRIRTTLLLDLRTAVKEAKSGPAADGSKLLRLLRLYDEMNGRTDALSVLQE